MADWDKRYREAPAHLFGAKPNEYLRQAIARSDVSPESALCLGDGDGRNGHWLAAQGLSVTALDLSQVATEQAEAIDRAANVSVERITADLAKWRAPKHRWDAAVMIFLQCEETVRRHAVLEAAKAINPGGWFLAEGFSRAGIEAVGLGPKSPGLLYDLDSLTSALPGFRIVEAFEGETWLDEGKRHQGAARVVRLLARKP